MKLSLFIFCFFIALATAITYDSTEQDSDEYEYQPRGLRLRRDYGCSVTNSNNYECNDNCREKFGCNWGQCEGFMRRFCRCRNADNSYC